MKAADTTYLDSLKRKLAAREASPGKEYKENCKTLRREIARLEGKPHVDE